MFLCSSDFLFPNSSEGGMLSLDQLFILLPSGNESRRSNGETVGFVPSKSNHPTETRSISSGTQLDLKN
ncbi:hypothetical protein HanPI659440_Chr09g0356831 [Helianthus annuus]|nr:hypothetical protein HanPI659440_Chr09g0356831 [Helianthus annuus]